MREGRCLAHTELAESALWKQARLLLDEGVVDSLEKGLLIASQTLDGAADHLGATVESVITCTDLFRKPIPGVSSPDTIEARRDELADSVDDRLSDADDGIDGTERWLRGHDPEYNGQKGRWGQKS